MGGLTGDCGPYASASGDFSGMNRDRNKNGSFLSAGYRSVARTYSRNSYRRAAVVRAGPPLLSRPGVECRARAQAACAQDTGAQLRQTRLSGAARARGGMEAGWGGGAMALGQRARKAQLWAESTSLDSISSTPTHGRTHPFPLVDVSPMPLF